MLQKIFGQIETKENFDALRISIASPDEIMSWSHGEVKKPETINYHSLKPEKDGLFCQQIFGPVRDYECECGKYKRIKFRGVVCERCGVEVISSSVRRERMGHIKLAMPVSHTWFLREGKISTLLNNLSQKKLEQVIYYDAYIVIEPGLTDLKLYDVISEDAYQTALKDFGADAFRVGIGADGIRDIISGMDLGAERTRLRSDLAETKSETKRRGIIKQLKLVESFLDSKSSPAWMIPDVIPVIPPDMRPLVPLEAGHIAASDLNDLYRRVIIRNNRLKKLIDLSAPEIIIRNEKRMLQEAVDSLFDNSHKARPLMSQNRHQLKSLSDSLRGKSGRFRMNMLGKRVDFSGRSVIVSGPTLKLHQCGLPKIMALELFKPFIYSRLMTGDYANTLKTAKKMVEHGEPIVWDLLADIVHEHPILLNRAPTLHRLGFLAFDPVLIEGKAIRLHPLVCKGFNADFDGDQMAVHVPISLEAQLEARTLMLSSNNVLNPSNGEVMIVPTQDMVLGVYYLSLIAGEHSEKSPRMANLDEIKLALNNKTVNYHTPIVTKFRGETIKTTPGRMLLGEILPEKMPFDSINKVLPIGEIKKLLTITYDTCGDQDMIILADKLKDLGFEYAARSGISFGFDDIRVPEGKPEIIEDAKNKLAEIESQYQNGLLSKNERHNKIVDMWQGVTTRIGEMAISGLRKVEGYNWNSLSMFTESGARGNKTQMQQLSGMRGMPLKPDNSIIEVPIISNFKEGLTMAEYFTSTHGTRKGMSDTALKTADAGYLTRRLVELAHNVVITEHDCGTNECITAKPVYTGSTLSVALGDVVLGRVAAQDIVHPITKELIVSKNDIITKAAAKIINASGLPSVDVRSVLTCQADGLCAKCYGMDLSRGTLVHEGEPVGIIAGHSIGEPGTQLTLRTFHLGGIATGTGGNNYLETPVAGRVKFDGLETIKNTENKLIVLSKHGKIIIMGKGDKALHEIAVPYAANLLAGDGDEVAAGAKLAGFEPYASIIVAEKTGQIKYSDLVDNVSLSEETDPLTGITNRKVSNWKNVTKKPLQPALLITGSDGKILSLGGRKTAEYFLPMGASINVRDGDMVNAGDVIAKIAINATKVHDITGGLPRVNELLEVRNPGTPALLSDIDGEVEIIDEGKAKIIVRVTPDDGTAEYEYAVPKGSALLVRNGDHIRRADMIIDGEISSRDILRIKGEKALAQFLVSQVQEVYRVQGVQINDKHMEIMIREMTRRVEIVDPGDTVFLAGQVIDRVDFEEENARVIHDGGKPAEISKVLVGLTRASITSRSFISNAAFQQTTKVLVDAAINGATDRLQGINENLIVGRLIPAGTGTYIRRAREIARQEELAEKLARENTVGEQQLLGI
jgi:DNA-directed RNA polymerase subunit beta'